MPQSADDFLGPPSADAFLGQRPSTQQPAVLPTIARLPLGMASSVLGGIENTLGLPGNIESIATHILQSSPSLSSVVTGGSAPTAGPPSIGQAFDQWMDLGGGMGGMGPLPTSSQIQAPTNALGLTNNPSLAPQSRGEAFAQAGAGGLGSALPVLATGGAALPIMLSGIGGGLGSEAGHEMSPNSPAAPIIGGLLGGGLTGGLADWGQGVAKSMAGAKAIEDAENALALSQEQALYGRNSAANTATQARGAAGDQFAQAKASAQARAEAIGTHADTGVQTIANSLGQSKTMVEAGQKLQDAGRDWISNILPAKEAAVWDPVTAQMAPNTPAPLANFVTALGTITKEGGALQPLRDLIIPSLPKALQDRVGGLLEDASATKAVPPTFAPSSLLDARGQPVLRQTSAGKPSEPITWEDARTLRSTLGDAMGNPQVLRDIGEQNLAHLYAATTADLRSSAAYGGALDEFDQANEESSRLRAFGDNVLGNVVSGKNAVQEAIKPEDAARAMLGKPSNLIALRAELPVAADELASAHLQQPGDPWSKLAPEAKQALVPDQSKSQAVDQLLGAKSQAKQAASASIAAAQEAKGAATADATQSQRDANFGLTEATYKARLALAQAKNAMTPKPNMMQHGIEALSGMGLGEMLGTVGLAPFGGGELTHGAIGGLLGLLGPKIVRGLATSSTRPQTYRNLAAGASGATNQLAPVPSGQ